MSFVLQSTYQYPIIGVSVTKGSQANMPWGSWVAAMREGAVIRNLSFETYHNTLDYDDYKGEYLVGAIDHTKKPMVESSVGDWRYKFQFPLADIIGSTGKANYSKGVSKTDDAKHGQGPGIFKDWFVV